jgi:hypothetical protein
MLSIMLSSPKREQVRQYCRGHNAQLLAFAPHRPEDFALDDVVRKLVPLRLAADCL